MKGAGLFHKMRDNAVSRNKRRLRAGLGSFIMLAVGTLPMLFSSPMQYLAGLLYSLFFAAAIAWLLY